MVILMTTMMMVNRLGTLIVILWMTVTTGSCPSYNGLVVTAFLIKHERHHNYSISLLGRLMGLYDKPLPPTPPSGRNDNNNKKENDDDDTDDDDDDDDDDDPFRRRRLFQMTTGGTEMNDLLPPLSRTLDSGIGCYFETKDRLVQNLVQKVGCHPDDAAWALEACRGNLQEAWTCIGVAQRQALWQNVYDYDDDGNDNNTDDDCEDNNDTEQRQPRRRRRILINEERPVSEQISQLMAENEYEQLKEERLEREGNERRMDYWRVVPDQEWLPSKNPKPIDDEPWFTG